ncbi:alkane 1-monooxygenase [Parasphingopyxis algicola]|uniref:alkane 1-monooxygenase n=1 Tax=Parasphingopyxis algicola TaxID=2026624 RepID=UPI0015A3F78B|nr:alkane 1-monooxygenase [Parasphingopyxis algicola]QLC25029.1 alkane 1-monooxygenase [Parasphingopyxis algicola]
MRYQLAYMIGLFSALAIVAGFYAGGLWLVAMVLALYFVLPFAERLIGESRWPSDARIAQIDRRTVDRYDLILYLTAASFILLVGWALWAVSVTPLTWWEFAAFALLMGEYGGFVGIVTAHELMHRNSKNKRQLAFLLLSLVSYAHFAIEHVRGHHVRVATPEDPATARRGETLYAFLPRTIIGGLRSAWNLEKERLARKGLPAFSGQNNILVWWGVTIALMIAIGLFIGPLSLLLFIVQGAVAIIALETINYTEHYGMERTKLPDGRYSRVKPEHSWNSSHILSNINMFNLGRHSDHHYQSNRPYYKLRHYDDVPQFPYGLAGMIMLATIPPLWFRVMDRELAAFENRAG